MSQVDEHSATCFRDAELTSRSRYVTEDDEQEHRAINAEINNRLSKLMQTLIAKLKDSKQPCLGPAGGIQLVDSIVECA